MHHFFELFPVVGITYNFLLDCYKLKYLAGFSLAATFDCNAAPPCS